MDYEFTIIGSGLGGLTLAALLTKEEKSVHLIEKNNRLGGCLGTFKRKNFTLETSLHVMNGVYSNENIINLFKKLDIYNNVDFISIPEFYSVKIDNKEYKLPIGINQLSNYLKSCFPEHEKEINKYFDLLNNIEEQIMDRSFVRNNMYQTAGEYIHKNIHNETLKLLLSANTLYYHDDPNDFSLITHLFAQSSFIKDSGYYIKNGSGSLVDYLEKYILSNNGKISKNSAVYNINYSKSEVTSIDYINNNRKYNSKVKNLVSNINPKITYDFMSKNSLDDTINEMLPSNSLFNIYLGFSKQLKEIFPNNSYSTFFFETIKNIDDFKTNNNNPIEKRDFVFVDYSQINSGLTDNNSSVGIIVGVDYYNDWERLNSLEYKKKKKEVTKSMISKLESYYPGISDYIIYSEMSTAKTVKKFTSNPNGSIYGFSQTPNQINRRFRQQSKDFKNLFFVGAWTKPGGGYSSVMQSGLQVFNLLKRLEQL